MRALQFIVDAREEQAVFAVPSQERLHGFERGAGGDKIVEHDAVGLGRENIEREHCPDALLGMTEGHILVERDR